MQNVRFIDNMNIRRKMLFIYLVAILLPFFTFGFLYTWYNNAAIEKQTLETMRSRTLNCTQMLDSQLMVYTSLSNLLSNNVELMKELESPYANILNALHVYQQVWDQYTANRLTWLDLRNITIYSANPTLHNSYPYLVRLDEYMDSQPEYEEIRSLGTTGCWFGFRKIQNREYWNPVNRSLKSGKYETFTYNRMLYSPKQLGVPIGMLTIEINSRPIVELISAQEDFSIVLLDQNNRFLVSSGTESSIDYLEVLEHPGENKVQLNGIWCYTDIATLSNGWKMVVTVPLEDVFAASNTTRNLGALLLLSISLIIIPMILLFSRQISKRHAKLISKMEAFMGGELYLEKPIGGKDEVALLDRDFTCLAAELKSRINETYILQLQKKQYHLEMLQTQINPHFLYNTLSTIAWLSDNHPREEIRTAVENLATFYRQTLSKGKDLITLEAEMQVVTAYLELQKLRYEKRISVYYDLDNLTLDVELPKLTIQPLVENSIRHGLSGGRETVSILLSSRIHHNLVEIEVRDDGNGMDAETLEKLLQGAVTSEEGSGLGFRNINDRIKLYFGKEYGLSAWSKSGVGTTVTVTLPFETAEQTPSDAVLSEQKEEN